MATRCYHDVHTMIHIEIFKNMLCDVCFKNIVVHHCSIVVASWRHCGIVGCNSNCYCCDIYLPCLLPKWHCIFAQYSTNYGSGANPGGSPVLLGNLYTTVWEGHAFLYM